MATSKPNKIDEIHNIVEMAQIMTALEIPSDGLRTLDEMRNRVKQSAIESSWTVGEVSINICIIQMI